MVRLHLSALGQTTFAQLAVIAQGFIAASLHGVSGAERATTLATLRKMNDNMDAYQKGTRDGL